MSAGTLHRRIDGGDFRGTSRSFTTLPRQAGSWPTCTQCGSSLYGRRVRVFERVIGGARMAVEKFKCPCGRGQEVRRAA